MRRTLAAAAAAVLLAVAGCAGEGALPDAAADDRGYVSAGLGYFLAPKVGGVGVDIAAGFSQQVAGSPRVQLDTVIGANIGIRLHPDL